MAWTSLDKPSRIHRQLWSGLLRAGESNVARGPKLHPHEKPVELMRFVIGYADPDRRLPIIDPYCGSGPVPVAAKDLGYPAIGIEIEERYCAIAVERLRQGVLFNVPATAPVSGDATKEDGRCPAPVAAEPWPLIVL